MEGPHRQLRARLADRLRGDDPDRVADGSQLTRGERAPVAGLADARRSLALEDRADRDRHDLSLARVLLPRLDDVGELRPVDLLALLDDHAAALGLDVL